MNLIKPSITTGLNNSNAFIMRMVAIMLAMTATVFAQDFFTREHRLAAQHTDRYGDMPLGGIIRTDDRYGNEGLFRGPRGWAYWNYLQNPKSYQNPNLWPDKRSTYFLGAFAMPAGSSLAIRGKFPHARYFKFSVYEFEHHTLVAKAGGSLAGWDIEPDIESSNPYIVGANRQVEDRSYTIHLIADNPPKNSADRKKNTVYVGREGKELFAGFRIYLSDEGYDGAGWGPCDVPSTAGALFTYEGKLADGTMLSAEEVVEKFARQMGSTPPPLSVDQWYAQVYSKKNDPNLDPAAAPARPDSKWSLFYGMEHAIQGAFMTPEERSKIRLQTEMEGGGDPTTAYMFTYLSRKFGPVYVFRAKMPTFPDTFSGAKTMPDGQVKYWSVSTMASPPSGALWDGVSDMMVPLDDQGYYTIVVSLPEDRPKNAVAENGITWINWGLGEGLNDLRDRKEWGMLLMRFMVCQQGWNNSPQKATKPGMEEAVMGPYYPKGYYTTKERFESGGLKKETAKNRGV